MSEQWIDPISLGGYDFSDSKAARDGKIIGLALKPALTEKRIKAWVLQPKTEFRV